jgi:plastocyanin
MKRKLLVYVTALMLVFLGASLWLVGYTQSLPAPTVDRVGFPTGYKDTFTLFYTFDNYQNRQIRKVYGNSTAASVTPDTTFNFPYGSVILFESYTVQEDARGEPVLDINGRFIPVNLTTIFVMRKEQGFGADYKELRNGEWEYVAYRPDGTYSTGPQNTGSCALCHLTGGSLNLTSNSKNIGAEWDYVFRPDLYLGGGTGAVPKGVLQHYVFVPSTIHAQEGDTVTVYNSDQLLHRIVADDNSFDTGVMEPGASFTVKAGKPGTVLSYHCVLHSRVKGQIVVDPPPPLPSVTGLSLSAGGVRAGDSYTATVTGSNLTSQLYFDVQFRAPNGATVLEAQNWQQGTTGSHSVPAGTMIGAWTFVGIRVHSDANDHTGGYTPVSVTINVVPF